jgi:hypothetical protein
MPFRSQSVQYQPLGEWLAACTIPRVTLTFAMIEAILGHALPSTAWSSSTWWRHSDERQQGPGGVWWAAGWQLAAVDRRQAQVTFVRR